jgi:hypothetical protein
MGKYCNTVLSVAKSWSLESNLETSASDTFGKLLYETLRER